MEQGEHQQTVAVVPGTLGAVLYPDRSKTRESERDWVALVHAVAKGEQAALHALYERTHRPVFTLIMRLRPDRETAEALTLDVFVDMWRRALAYDPAHGTVLAWIMNLARARAAPAEPDQSRQSGEVLRAALAALRPDERDEIEAAYFAGLPHSARPDPLRPAEAARGHRRQAGNQPLRAVRGHLRVRAVGAAAGRGDGGGGAHRVLRAVRARAGAPAAGRRAVRLVAGSSPAPERILSRWLAYRIAAETGREPVMPAASQWSEPAWEVVAPGISCKLLATDNDRHLVSMLVRLVPGGSYPAHTHAADEQLHLLDGELWIDERKVFPGDYYRAEPGSGDRACVERDRLRLRAGHQHQGRPALT